MTLYAFQNVLYKFQYFLITLVGPLKSLALDKPAWTFLEPLVPKISNTKECTVLCYSTYNLSLSSLMFPAYSALIFIVVTAAPSAPPLLIALQRKN